MKKYLKSLLYSLIIIIILTFILTIFNYINFISGNILKIFKVLILFLIYFIPSFIIGYNSFNKGWIKGLNFGLILTSIILLLNLIVKNKISIITILLYLIFICTSIIGSIIGINISKKNKTK